MTLKHSHMRRRLIYKISVCICISRISYNILLYIQYVITYVNYNTIMSRIIDDDNDNESMLLKQQQGNVLMYFWAPWSDVCKELDVVIDAIEMEYKDSVRIARIEAEKSLKLSARFGVEAVPLCVLLVDGVVKERVQGMDPIELQEKMGRVFSVDTKGTMSLEERLDGLVGKERVMLFMKGSPDAPKCGFSQKAVQALRESGCHDFGYFDILEDQEVRQGLKEKSKWPTYPQLYVNGELLGGCDIILEMHQDGSLKDEL